MTLFSVRRHHGGGAEVGGLPPGTSAEVIRAQLEKILRSRAFAQSGRHSRFLRFIVEQYLDSQADKLKEYLLGVEVFGRKATFDPHTDPIVRVEASRVRVKLKEYYESAGRNDPILIEFPRGSYVPVFRKQRVWARNAGQILAWFRSPRWRVIALLMTLLAAMVIWMASSSWRLHSSTPGRTAFSIAVLPLLNLSADKESEHLSDGLTDEIINELSNEPRLRVLARTSTFQFKGKAEDLRALGARLQVNAILEGSVWKNTERLRVSVRLVNVADGYPLWSDVYDQALKQDVLSAQQELSRAIVGTLRDRLWDGQTRLAQVYTENLAVYNLYLEGVWLQRSANEEDLKKSIASFQKAITAEANYAPAYAGLADSYTALAMLGLAPPREVLSKAKEAAERARALDDGLAEAHTALGMNRAVYEWNWAVAKREFQRALELNPGDGGVHRAYALTWLVPRGELREALEELQAFQKLAPVSPGQHALSGAIRYYRREYDQAIQEYQRELEGNPASYLGYVALGSASALKGRYREAEVALQRGRVAWGGGAGSAILGHTFALMGVRSKAQEILNELTALSQTRYVAKYCLALVEVGLGAKEQALRRLEEAADEREPMLIYLNVDPWFDSLRSEPRFRALVKKIGLLN